MRFVGANQVSNSFPCILRIFVIPIPALLGQVTASQCFEDSWVCAFTIIIMKTILGCFLLCSPIAEPNRSALLRSQLVQKENIAATMLSELVVGAADGTDPTPL